MPSTFVAFKSTSAPISIARSAAAVSVVKNGLPVPAPKIATRFFSRWRIARRRVYGSARWLIGVALCTRAAPRVLPAPGAGDVPTNARLWRLPATSAPDQPIASYELAPHTHYEIRDGNTSFTTGASPDGSAPVEPGLAMVSITLTGSDSTGRKQVSILHVASMMDSDDTDVRLT